MKQDESVFCITYVMIYMFLPDSGDIGERYFFFGLMHSNSLAVMAEMAFSMASWKILFYLFYK